jgi:hypothetical protein
MDGINKNERVLVSRRIVSICSVPSGTFDAYLRGILVCHLHPNALFDVLVQLPGQYHTEPARIGTGSA